MANRTWRVKFQSLKKCYGKTYPDRALIKVAQELDSEMILQTFLHELLHAAAGTIGWTELNEDEAKIDALAAMLAQAITTAE